MLSVDQASKMEVISPSATRLTLHSFDDQQPLWEKGKHAGIPNHAIKGAKRYPFFKLGKILGIQTYRYLSIYDRYLFYFEEAQGGACKGMCNLENRYIQWHKTSKGKYLLVVSNTNQTSLLFFDGCGFWNDNKEEIVKHGIRTSFQKEYNMLQLLGEGSFSNVFLVRNKGNGRKYAAKKIAKFDKNNKSTKKLVIEERKILNQLKDCRYASRLVEFYEENNEYILVLEHVEGKDLLGFLKCTPDVTIDAIKLILTSILVCLKAVHSEKIIHRDIKPHNILINTDLKCKLIDFGLSLDAKNPLEKSHFKKCGTVGYMAPQVFANEFSYMKPYNTKCDMFSLGIIAHMLLMGNNPIKGKSYEQSYQLNRQCKIVLDQKKITEHYGAQCLSFLQKLLQNNAKYRYSAEEALNCKFLQEVHEKEDKMSISTLDEKRKLSEESFLK